MGGEGANWQVDADLAGRRRGVLEGVWGLRQNSFGNLEGQCGRVCLQERVTGCVNAAITLSLS